MADQGFQCDCGMEFPERNDLVRHNVDAHETSEQESRQAVEEKYPIDRAA